jgi:hypothetical protein
MSYPLSTSRVDEVSITGKTTAGRTWANVIHGLTHDPLGIVQSSDLITAIEAVWVATVKLNITNLTTMTRITSRQVVGLKPKYGSFYLVNFTLVAGSITAALIVDAGSGYKNGTELIPIYDPTGLGAVVYGTWAGGSLASVDVDAGGAGYTAPVSTQDLPDGTSPVPNRLEWMYGAQDFAAFTDTGGVLPDSLPSFNSWSIRLRSAAPGRYGRSSAHWPGVPESDTVNDAFTGGAVTFANGSAVSMYATPIPGPFGTTWVCGTYSKLQLARQTPKGAITVSNPYFSPISTAVCNVNVGSMLRRKAIV